ncbi:hypothetical protein [Devosia sp. 1566]|uniref:hypothetical protein n=1 Tax=Devosia sp. 1566 TaxID=2499144 RepID=UPI000FD970B7|nr:hypothetical protein [Devosia sp. 1566]
MRPSTVILLAIGGMLLVLTPALSQSLSTLRGEVSVGTLDSAIGEYSFLTDSTVGDAIFASCQMGDLCEIQALVQNEQIVAVASAKKVPVGPPSPEAVYDTRYACLYGSMEGEQLADADRIEMCDALGQLEAEALDAGYCWNQMAGEYKSCE